MSTSAPDARIVVIGSGNVAEALCAWIPRSGYELVQLFARNPARGKPIAERAGCPYEQNPTRLAAADMYLIAVSDRAIRELSETLDFGEAVVVHTSGSCDAEELSPQIHHRGVLYPLQTFTAGRSVNFKEIPIFVEAAQEETYKRIYALASALSDSVYRSDALLRRTLHVAAVFVCNFVNDLYVVGEAWMRENGMPFDVLKPLIAETTGKMLESPSPRQLQTGPAVREDLPTIGKHLALLDGYPDLRRIYELLTEHIIKMKLSDGKL